MKEKVLFHIGYHKTATTWLQNELFIADSNVFHPLTEKTNKFSSFAKQFIYGKNNSQLNSADLNKQRILKKKDRILSQNPIPENKIAVVSHERLSGSPLTGGFDASIIARRIKASFPDAKIFMMIREQGSMIRSNYTQYLDVGGTRSLNKFLFTRYDAKQAQFAFANFKYSYLIEEYYSLFGKNNVLVLPYELFKENKKLFINKLEDFIDRKIEISLDSFEQKWNTKEHPYLNYKLRKLNIFRNSSSMNNYSKWNKPLLKMIVEGIIHVLDKFVSAKKNKETYTNLELKIARIIGNQYEEDNKKTEKLIQIDLKQYAYY